MRRPTRTSLARLSRLARLALLTALMPFILGQAPGTVPARQASADGCDPGVTACSMTLAQPSVAGFTAATDRHVWRIDVPTSGVIEIFLENRLPVDLDLYLQGPGPTLLASAERDYPASETLHAQTQQPGEHLVVVQVNAAHRAVQMSPDSTYTLWALGDPAMLVAAQARPSDEVSVIDAGGPVQALAISPDGTVLAAGLQSGAIRLWSMPEGAPIRNLPGHTLSGSGGSVKTLTFAPGGRTLASGASSDSSVRFWRIPDGAEASERIESFTDTPLAAYSPDGQLVAIPYSSSQTRVYRVADQGLIHEIDGARWPAWSPDGRRLLTLAGGGRSAPTTVTVWNIESWTPLRQFEARDLALITNTAISPDGERLLISSQGRTGVWRIDDGASLFTFFATGGSAACTGQFAAYAPNGQHIATAATCDRYPHTRLRVWSAADGSLSHPYYGHLIGATAATFSPDGQFLISGSPDGTIRVWNARER